MHDEHRYQTLMLNGDAAPMGVWSWREGLQAVLGGSAISVHDHPVDARSARLTVPVPSVAILRRFHHIHRLAPFTRRNVFLCYAAWENGRPLWHCCLCGRVERRSEDLTFEHVIPRAQGGLNTWNNIGLAHASCNNRKGNRTLAQAGMVLHVRLREPTEREIILRRIRHQFPRGTPDGWNTFVSAAYWDATIEP